MIAKLVKNPNAAKVDELLARLSEMGVKGQLIQGGAAMVIAIIGDTTKVDQDFLHAQDIIEDVTRIQEPYKLACRKIHPTDTVVTVGGTAKIGGDNFAMSAGPCSVESREQLCTIAESVKASGATVLRGGAFKPRTSPYAFQGMRDAGIDLLVEAKRQTGLPIVTEIMDISQLPLFDEVDMIQVGARNMQNFELLKELGRLRRPILLKRGLCATLDELLMSAEYIMAGGNTQVVLCERGIRTFETATRNTLDLSCVPVLKQRTHLPVIIDPSHATGKSAYVAPLALAAAAIGADGLIIEVHNNPACAVCDGPQSLTPAAFDPLAGQIRAILPSAYRY
ncbi:MAG: 3-deoxy-7-phosphoheptulonate synthase [Clostridia bacterium]|nr:3-deoxy-7-phosphoheptulonate synthase [Clostridia bacterium]